MDDTASHDDAPGEHGRIGYGRYGRFTPLALSALLIAGLLAIGIYQRRDDGAGRSGDLAGNLAPDVTLTRLDGSPLRLADLRGSVVVVNFWASWCEPCRDESPAFQAVSTEATQSAESFVIIGVGLKNDKDEDARAFVADLGLTYPIGRDTGGDNPTRGPIELAFGIDPFYPMTLFIRPDGVIDTVHLGPLDADAISAGIAAAADR